MRACHHAYVSIQIHAPVDISLSFISYEEIRLIGIQVTQLDDTFNSFDTIQECDERTDGQNCHNTLRSFSVVQQ